MGMMGGKCKTKLSYVRIALDKHFTAIYLTNDVLHQSSYISIFRKCPAFKMLKYIDDGLTLSRVTSKTQCPIEIWETENLWKYLHTQRRIRFEFLLFLCQI